MLGLRGCRPGIVYPELNVMQVRAIAWLPSSRRRASTPSPGDHDSACCLESEIELVRAMSRRPWLRSRRRRGVKLEIPIGTTIELPRAAITADDRQARRLLLLSAPPTSPRLRLGFSRDDVESAFMPPLPRQASIVKEPSTVDPVLLGRPDGRRGCRAEPDIVCASAGKRPGGDPESIQVHYDLGLDYVSLPAGTAPIAPSAQRSQASTPTAVPPRSPSILALMHV